MKKYFLLGFFVGVCISSGPVTSQVQKNSPAKVVSSADTACVSIRERLNRAELELFFLKLERYKLQRALEQKQKPPRRKVVVFRRPCT